MKRWRKLMSDKNRNSVLSHFQIVPDSKTFFIPHQSFPDYRLLYEAGFATAESIRLTAEFSPLIVDFVEGIKSAIESYSKSEDFTIQLSTAEVMITNLLQELDMATESVAFSLFKWDSKIIELESRLSKQYCGTGENINELTYNIYLGITPEPVDWPSKSCQKISNAVSSQLRLANELRISMVCGFNRQRFPTEYYSVALPAHTQIERIVAAIKGSAEKWDALVHRAILGRETMHGVAAQIKQEEDPKKRKRHRSQPIIDFIEKKRANGEEPRRPDMVKQLVDAKVSPSEGAAKIALNRMTQIGAITPPLLPGIGARKKDNA
jgi:hypothetical protein